MKVLHIIPSIASKRGGPSTAIISMVRTLRLEGIDAAILTTTDNAINQNQDYPLGKWFEKDGVPVIMFPVASSNIRLLSEFLFSPGLSVWLFKNIRIYDMIHIHAIFSYPSTVSMMIARFKRIPYVVRTIGQLNRWSLSQSTILKKIMLAVVERGNLENSVAVQVTSKNEKEDIEELNFNIKLLLLGLGVEIPEKDNFQILSTVNVDTTKFLFLSRLHPKKQLDKLLYAFSRIKRECPEYKWCLFIAGDGDEYYVKELHQLTTSLDLDDEILWMGHVQGLEKKLLFSNTDWFVLPSASENFGISVAEALSYGIPVIITEGVGVSELVEKYQAGMIAKDSTVHLASTLKTAISKPPEEMKNAATHLALENFSWKKVVHHLINFYFESIRTFKKS